MRRISKVAVLGSGVMGSGIACHFANIGLEVLMLDILPKDIDAHPDDGDYRNSIAREALKKAVKSKPAPLYRNDFVSRITTGNFEDHMRDIGNCDWIIEVVVERLDVKQQIFGQVDQFRKPGSIVSTNTSGIPIGLMLNGRSEDFRKHFLGTHFFNPPRYLRLLEIIPSAETDPSVVSFMMDFGNQYLGKETVLCRDTPAFIANRIGVYAMAKIYALTHELGLSIKDVDKLTGPVIGRPKTGTFRLSDLVGLDVAEKVIKGIRQNCPDDEQMADLEIPEFLQFLLDNKFYGNKSGQGFYLKTDAQDERGKTIIKALNLETLAYTVPPRSNLPSLTLAKQIDNTKRRIRALWKAEDPGGALVRRSLAALFAYISNRIPEITDALYNIDKAVKAGFGWDYGPFEYWDIIGLEEGIQEAEKEGYAVADWVHELQKKEDKSFYRRKGATREYFDILSGTHIAIPGMEQLIILDDLRETPPVYKNDEVVLHDIGDAVLCLEFRSKMNAIGEGILRGIQEAIGIAESGDWRGLVIGNQAQHFTVGANLMLIGMYAFQEEFDELALAVKMFQDTMTRCRFSAIPVVTATQGYTFGGGCEMLMHCDGVAAAAESYIGLVEVGVGLLPGGGGTKEFAVRASDAFFEGDVRIPTLLDKFKTIALATVSTSAHEAFDHGYLLQKKDRVVINTMQNILEAKQMVLRLSDGYVKPVPREDILVLGRQGLASLYVAANSLYRGNYASDHDIKIAQKIAFVLCGGDLSAPQQVSEQYLLDLEREAFVSLAAEPKTMERIQHMLETGKPLRN